MRKWLVLVAAISLALGAAGMAGAAPLNWEGTGTVIIADIPPVPITGGGVATVNNSAGGVPNHLNTLRLKASRGGITGTDTAYITDPETAGNGIAAVRVIEAGGTGTLGPISGAMASTLPGLTMNLLPVYGMAQICFLDSNCAATILTVPFTLPTTVNGVPGTGLQAAVGMGGLITAGGVRFIRLSLQAAPWTVKTTTLVDHLTLPGGTQTFVNQTVKGFAHGPGTGTTSTAAVSGVVQLISPGQIWSNIPMGSNDKLAGMAVMVIHFIPEPGLLLLLGSGVLGLCLLGRRRMR
jgi:hypothetical protein